MIIVVVVIVTVVIVLVVVVVVIIVVIMMTVVVVINRYYCFSVKYAIRRFRVKLHPGYDDIFFISSLEKQSVSSFLYFFPVDFLLVFLFLGIHIYLMKRKFHVGFNISSSCRKKSF